MTFWEEMRDVVAELLGPGSDFGEPLTMQKPGTAYDPETRRAVTAPGTPYTVWGTLDAELSPVAAQGNMTARFERVLYAVPVASIEPPGNNWRVIAEGQTWQVMETAHVIKAGIPVIWICGLEST